MAIKCYTSPMILDFPHLQSRFIDAARRDDQLDANYAIRITSLRLLEGIQTFFARNPSIEAVGPAIPAFHVDGSTIRLAFWGDDPHDQPAADHFQAWVDSELKSNYQWARPQLAVVARCVFNHGQPEYTQITRANLIEGVLRTVGDEVGVEVRAMMEAEKLGTATNRAIGHSVFPRL
jgi:hypothetical protein